MNLDELRNIDINDISSWPLVIKMAAILFICAAILVGGYFAFIDSQLEEWDTKKQEEEKLKQTYMGKKALAVNLPAYRQQMEDMERTFDSMRRQLPSKTEVPDILVDITQAGLGRGLKFRLFDPLPEKKKEFYAELPIKLYVLGSYHEIALFISDLAALPRIVTIGNIQMAASKSGKISMRATAKTYRALEVGETTGKARKKKRRARGR
jgi:type IV pilus assembly protein PilO